MAVGASSSWCRRRLPAGTAHVIALPPPPHPRDGGAASAVPPVAWRAALAPTLSSQGGVATQSALGWDDVREVVAAAQEAVRALESKLEPVRECAPCFFYIGDNDTDLEELPSPRVGVFEDTSGQGSDEGIGVTEVFNCDPEEAVHLDAGDPVVGQHRASKGAGQPCCQAESGLGGVLVQEPERTPEEFCGSGPGGVNAFTFNAAVGGCGDDGDGGAGPGFPLPRTASAADAVLLSAAIGDASLGLLSAASGGGGGDGNRCEVPDALTFNAAVGANSVAGIAAVHAANAFTFEAAIGCSSCAGLAAGAVGAAAVAAHAFTFVTAIGDSSGFGSAADEISDGAAIGSTSGASAANASSFGAAVGGTNRGALSNAVFSDAAIGIRGAAMGGTNQGASTAFFSNAAIGGCGAVGEAAETVGEAWLDALREYNALRCQGPRAAATGDAEVLEQLHGSAEVGTRFPQAPLGRGRGRNARRRAAQRRSSDAAEALSRSSVFVQACAPTRGGTRRDTRSTSCGGGGGGGSGGSVCLVGVGGGAARVAALAAPIPDGLLSDAVRIRDDAIAAFRAGDLPRLRQAVLDADALRATVAA